MYSVVKRSGDWNNINVWRTTHISRQHKLKLFRNESRIIPVLLYTTEIWKILPLLLKISKSIRWSDTILWTKVVKLMSSHQWSRNEGGPGLDKLCEKWDCKKRCFTWLELIRNKKACTTSEYSGVRFLEKWKVQGSSGLD